MGFWDELENAGTRWAGIVLDLGFFRAQDPLQGVVATGDTSPDGKREVLRYLQRTNVLDDVSLAIVQARELARWMNENSDWVEQGCWNPESNRRQWAEQAGVIESFLAPDAVQFLLTPDHVRCGGPTVALMSDLPSPWWVDAREGFFALAMASSEWYDRNRARPVGSTQDPEGKTVWREIHGASENVFAWLGSEGFPSDPDVDKWRLRYNLAEVLAWPEWHQLDSILDPLMKQPLEQALAGWYEIVELYDEATGYRYSTADELWRAFVEDTTPPEGFRVEPWMKRVPFLAQVGPATAKQVVENRAYLPTRM